ncbi:MAG TPA: serine/threonine-protein kinase, partial [Polyangiales bacterium]|nr:serine/threonine-protein kinase [Polyangiales bacterium]
MSSNKGLTDRPVSTGRGASGAEPVRSGRPLPPSIGGYRVLDELGRGGMARVYRVLEESSGRELALKQLQLENDEQRKQFSVLFEREYRTLVQLRHPSVIEVYDYGVVDDAPHYTMELLDGGDLRTRSPLPWRQACELLFDVCSSLALLHSRRLVHRDITPRNVRCTQAGSAKLIDFGAMAPMGPSRQVVGTPAFVAPEVVYRSALDGRTDLYSLGATLYYALTGRVPYPARQLSEMLEAWGRRPPAPSVIAPDVPEELDRLVMELLSLEPALRPRGAYEVMQRLRALAGIEREEPASVSAAYLATPVLVGREEPLFAFRGQIQRALRAHGGGVLVGAQPGLGRSRVLDAVALEAKLLGATPVRANANGDHHGQLAVARSLAEQLI